MNSRLRIIVTGLVGLYPIGGVTWDYFQYLIGLARLGHDVVYHEDTCCWPFLPTKHTFTADESYSVQFIGHLMQRYASPLAKRWHYVHLHETSFGMDRTSFNDIARTADLFLNVSRACTVPELTNIRYPGEK